MFGLAQKENPSYPVPRIQNLVPEAREINGKASGRGPRIGTPNGTLAHANKALKKKKKKKKKNAAPSSCNFDPYPSVAKNDVDKLLHQWMGASYMSIRVPNPSQKTRTGP